MSSCAACAAGEDRGQAAVDGRVRSPVSLNELSQQAGIGKSTLSMLESGRANPSIETLWAIASALGVPFGHLIEPRSPDVRVVRSGAGIKVQAEAAALTVHMLTSSHRRRTFEVYVMQSEPGPVHEADGHILGTIEPCSCSPVACALALGTAR